MLGEGVGTTNLIIKDNVRALRCALRGKRDSLAAAAANRSLRVYDVIGCGGGLGVEGGEGGDVGCHQD